MCEFCETRYAVALTKNGNHRACSPCLVTEELNLVAVEGGITFRSLDVLV
jgi:hypothetical protein